MRTIMILTLCVLSFFVYSGCIPRKETRSPLIPQRVPALEESKVVSAAQSREEWRERWDSVVSSARKEGKVIVYSTTGGEMRDVVGRAFKERYGIGADFLVAKGSQIAEKVAAERRAGLYIPDVYLGGAQTAITYLKPKGYLAPLEPALILPEVIESRFWWEGEFPWIDKSRFIVGFTSFASVPIAINTNLVKPEEITSYRDLLKPGWKGKLLMNDITMTGAGGAWFNSVLLIVALDFMRELAKQEPIIIVDYRLQVEWLARGKYSILVAPHPPTLTEFMRAGAPLKGITPLEGTYRTTGSGNVALFNETPNLNAARLFINWLLYKEGQTDYMRVTGYPSARIDVPPEDVDPLRILDTKIKYVNGNSEENLLRQEENLNLAKEIFGPLKK